MNRDQVNGRLKEARGKVQEKAGKATGNTSARLKGMARQASGKLQKTAGDSRENARKGRY